MRRTLVARLACSVLGFAAAAVALPSTRADALASVPRLSVTTVVSGLDHPWDVAFLPDGTMFFTQRFTPQAGMDPMQARMMAVMMPVMMGVISWNLSSGLGIYWAVGNLIGLAQQVWMNNTEFGRQVRAHHEERARKPRK